ncbi:MAG TPA: TetR family transcriptional regulator C-terminal domain-containing protein, partial [Halococcus sp.]|nr:TetR family transcriptional regulator C-terminal domain-containing protein [Halococcus sp.]
RLRTQEGENPTERLGSFIERALTPPQRDDQQAFQTAMLEVKAQAPYNDAFNDQIARFDGLLYEQCRSIITDGIEQGVFREVDADAVATFFVALCNGAHVLWVTENRSADTMRRLFIDYVESQLLADTPEPAVE